MRRLTIFTAGIWLTLVSTALPSDFATGAAAYDGGRYAEAFATWRALASQGDTRARVAVAGMHRHGEGRPIDYAKAVRWYRLAADDGDGEARRILGRDELFEERVELRERRWQTGQVVGHPADERRSIGICGVRDSLGLQPRQDVVVDLVARPVRFANRRRVVVRPRELLRAAPAHWGARPPVRRDCGPSRAPAA